MKNWLAKRIREAITLFAKCNICCKKLNGIEMLVLNHSVIPLMKDFVI